jgi:paraquat-inducible protein A
MTPTAARAGLLLCLACDLLNHPASADTPAACARCGASLHWRKPSSLTSSWAFLVAACLLYVPANALPVMDSGSVFGSQSDTIMSGVRFLWHSGDWLIAAIIFFASIVLPGAKIVALALVLGTTQRRSLWRPGERARLFRFMEVVGRWSMVDIFVLALLVGVVQFKTVAVVEPGPGALAFAAVVVFTMAAALSFDARLIWDPVDGYHE